MKKYKVLTSPWLSRILRLNSFPSKMRKSSPGFKIPHFVEIERAVLMLSPVTMRTVIPALWHFLIASGTCNIGTHKSVHAGFQLKLISNETGQK